MTSYQKGFNDGQEEGKQQTLKDVLGFLNKLLRYHGDNKYSLILPMIRLKKTQIKKELGEMK